VGLVLHPAPANHGIVFVRTDLGGEVEIPAQAAQVVDTAYALAGATAIFESQPFERRFRDVHAVTQQIHGRDAHFEAVGRYLLGLDPASTFV
jgi:hypothetical protein